MSLHERRQRKLLSVVLQNACIFHYWHGNVYQYQRNVNRQIRCMVSTVLYTRNP